MKYYEGLVDSVLDPVGESGGGKDIIYRCPFCEGIKGSGHLYINYDKNLYHCYKCGVGGRDIRSLLRLMGISLEEEVPVSLLQRNSKSMELDKLLNPTEKKIEGRNVDKTTKFFMEHTKDLSPVSRQYLYNRGISDEEILMYHMREGIDRRGSYVEGLRGQNYAGRILVPSLVENNKVSYFVARDYMNSSTRKYLNPPADLAYSSEDVWNLTLARKVSSTVIICEGVFTAIAAGRGKYNAVATYGKSIAEVSNRDQGKMSQGVQLLEAGFDKYIVAYDADATKELLSTCEYLSSRGADTYFIKVPPKYGPHSDISDFTRAEYLELLSNMKKYNKSSQLDLIC